MSPRLSRCVFQLALRLSDAAPLHGAVQLEPFLAKRHSPKQHCNTERRYMCHGLERASRPRTIARSSNIFQVCRRSYATEIPPDPYKIFGLPPDASSVEIKTKYYALSKKYHPDIGTQKDNTKFIRLNNANEAIGTQAAKDAWWSSGIASVYYPAKVRAIKDAERLAAQTKEIQAREAEEKRRKKMEEDAARLGAQADTFRKKWEHDKRIRENKEAEVEHEKWLKSPAGKAWMKRQAEDDRMRADQKLKLQQKLQEEAKRKATMADNISKVRAQREKLAADNMARVIAEREKLAAEAARKVKEEREEEKARQAKEKGLIEKEEKAKAKAKADWVLKLVLAGGTLIAAHLLTWWQDITDYFDPDYC